MSDDADPGSEPQAPQRGLIRREDMDFLPRVRWRLWGLVALVLVGFSLTWYLRGARNTRRQREALLREHAVLTGGLAPPYRQLRERMESLTFSVLGPWQGTWHEPSFRFENLTEGAGIVYGRVRIPEIHRQQEVEASLRHRYPDMLYGCLGIPVDLAPMIYLRGEFLMPAYVESVRGDDNGQRLGYLRDDLRFRLRRDTEDLVRWNRARYFVLAVDEAALSIHGATRVYIFDLESRRVLARDRSEGDTTRLIPLRLASVPGLERPSPPMPGELAVGSHDCSVANAVRSSLGAPTFEMPHAPEIAPAVTDAGPVAEAGAR